MTRTPIERRRLAGSRVFVASILVLAMLSSSKWEYSMVGAILFAVGCAFVSIGTVGRIWCGSYVAGNKTHTLITNGPYSLCRNPLYLFSAIAGTGVALTMEMVTPAVILLILFALYYPLIIRKEESRLLETHGERFKEYCRQVPSFIPSFRAFREEETQVINVRLFRKNIRDASWFVVFVGFFEVVERLHQLHIVPTYFKVY